MSEEKYLFSGGREDVELSRLRTQEGFVDPVTIRHLETIGVVEGWRCLEVGAGAGSIAQWMSSRIGSTGKVVATDLNTRFLSRLNTSNLEIREHDILRDGLEAGYYDLAHCRKLLSHLPNPEKALQRMADAVRPGGWLLIEDDDLGSMLSVDAVDSSYSSFAVAVRSFLDCVRRRGIVDYYFGRRVRGLVEGLGLIDVGQDGWTIMARGADPISRYLSDSWKAAKPMTVGEIFTEEHYDTIQSRIMDPAFYYPIYTLFSVWGKKPVQGGGT